MIVILAVLVAVLAGGAFASLKDVPNGYAGIVSRGTALMSVRQPGRVVLIPIVERLHLIDLRETPYPKRIVEVVTADGIREMLVMTLYTQVVDAEKAFASLSDLSGVEALAASALRDVCRGIGAAELQSRLSEAEMQVTFSVSGKTQPWGLSIRRVSVEPAPSGH